MSAHPPVPPALDEMDTIRFRQRLAGLIDANEAIAPQLKEVSRLNAIRFTATLPSLFGSNLDRMTLWSRIASGIESAAAKTATGDYEFFITEVLNHIQCDKGRAACSIRVSQVMEVLEASTVTERQGWIDYLATHVTTLLIHAKRDWERYKTDAKSGRDLSWWGEQPEFAEVFINE